jgi:hypothetical protein
MIAINVLRALIFYEAGSFPQRLLVRLGVRDQRALSRLIKRARLAGFGFPTAGQGAS